MALTKICDLCFKEGGERTGTAVSNILESVLPENYSHLVCSYEELGGTNFRAALKLKLTNEQEVLKWLEDFQKSSGVTWRTSKTYPNSWRSNKYRADFKCQHKTNSSSKRSKNTNCSATMYLILKRKEYSQGRSSRSGDLHTRAGFYFHVNLRHEHNHDVSCAEAMRRRDVSSATVEKLTSLFQNGHTPSSALDLIKYDLREQEGRNYVSAAADRSVCPDPQFCYRLYYKLFKKADGASAGQEVRTNLQARLDQFNEEQGETCAKMAATEREELVIAVCTPLMKRVHVKVRQSGEMVFIDSSGKCDRQNHQIFLFLTHSGAGGLPLGVLIATSEDQATITSGIQLLKSIVPPQGFFGRHEQGPTVIMTDDCSALRSSLQTVYPEAKLLLCVFHLVRAAWRWLWSSHNKVAKEHRPHLLSGFKGLVYADTPHALAERNEELLADQTIMRYAKFAHHVEAVYERCEEWAVCLHSDLPTRGVHTNNFVETAMDVLKDKVFHRLKAYNVTQLADFVITRMEAYYIRCLTDVANNVAPCSRNKWTPQGNDIDCATIVQDDASNYTVLSGTSKVPFHVNTDIGCCTCPGGIYGGACKHQSAVISKFGNDDTSPHISTPQMTKLYLEIATDGGSTHYDDDDDDVVLIKDVASDGGIEEAMEDYAPALDKSHSGKSEELEDQLMELFESWKHKLRWHPTLKTPLASFISSAKRITTDGALISAWSTFGKYPIFPTRHYKRPRGYPETLGQIGVQSTAMARRRAALGGRRTQRRVSGEHSYPTHGTKSDASIAQCVPEAVSLQQVEYS